MIQQIIYIITGLIFILGGALKWVNLPVFEFQLVKDGLAAWGWAGYFSRLITGAEIILGILLLFNKPFRKYAAYAVLFMLAAFTAYLIYSLIHYGSSGNCGCFGEAIPVSTEASIVKNIVMFVLLLIVLIKDKTETSLELKTLPRLRAVTGVAIIIVVYALIFTITPVKKYSEPERGIRQSTAISANDSLTVAGRNELPATKDSARNIKLKPIQQTPAEKTTDKYKQAVSEFSSYKYYSTGVFNPDEGEKMVALFSLDCEHCLSAATKMAKQKSKLPQILILFMGEKEQVAPFFSQSGLEAPYIILTPEQFFPLLKQSPPRIVRLVRGNVVKEWEGEF